MLMACILMAYILAAYILMAYVLMAYILMAYRVMAYMLMAYILAAYMLMAYRVMALADRPHFASPAEDHRVMVPRVNGTAMVGPRHQGIQGRPKAPGYPG